MRASSSVEVLDLKGSVVLDLLKAPKARPERRVVSPAHSLTLRRERDIDDIVAQLTSPVEPVKTTKKGTYVDRLVSAGVFSEEDAAYLKRTDKYMVNAHTLYNGLKHHKNLKVKALFSSGKFSLSSMVGLKGIQMLLKSKPHVQGFLDQTIIALQGANTDKNWIETLFALKHEPVRQLIDTGFDNIAGLIEMVNVDGGVELVGRIQDYLNIAIDGVEDVLGIKDMSILSLEKTFSPENWPNLKNTLMNSSFQKIAKAGIGNLKEILKIGKVGPEGLAVLGNIEEYLTGLLGGAEEFLGVGELSAAKLAETFDPANWENMRKTLASKEIGDYARALSSVINVDKLIVLSKNENLDRFLEVGGNLLDLLGNSKVSPQVFIDILNSGKRPEEIAISFIGQGIKFIDGLDGEVDGQYGCCAKLFSRRARRGGSSRDGTG